LEALDSKVKLEGPSKSPRESPPPSQDAGRPFKIKEDGEDGDRERSSTPKGRQGKIHMRGLLGTQVGQLAGRPMGNKEEYPRQLQGPKTAKANQTHSGEMKDHTKTMKITTERPEFEMPSHYMKEVVASVKTKGQSHHVKTKNTTKPKNKPVPKTVRKWAPKIATPAKSVDPK
jgi:hypothetical protein